MTLGRRYLIYGVTGSGKSTLATEMAARTGLPWILVDDLTWMPGWVPVSEDEQRRRIQQVCAEDNWILDSPYGSWLDVPLATAYVIVGPDYPRWLSLWRVTTRTLKRVVDRRPVCGGNVETWRRVFSMDSMMIWHFRSFSRKRTRIRGWEADSPGPQIVRLASRRQTRDWLDSLEQEAR